MQRVENLVRTLSIKSKVTLVGVATAFGGLLVALVAFVSLATWQHRTQSQTELERVGGIVAAYSTAPLLFGDKDTAAETLAGFKRDDWILAAGVYDASGQLFATFERDSTGASLIPSDPGSGYSSAGLDPELFWPVELDGELLGTVYLRSDGQRLSSQINDLSMIVGVVMFICLLISIVISSKLQRVISDPILRLAGTAREVSENKTYSARVVKETNDEVGQLYDAFNAMLIQIEDRDEFLERQVEARTAELVSANEQLIESKERAEEADRLKGEFLANISHEIRTPMGVICGMTELTLRTDIDKKQRRNLEMVLASSDSLLKLINELLDLSKIEAGKMELNEADFDLKQSLSESLETLGIMARQKQISLRHEVDAQIPTTLFGDVDRLRQILNNIVGNAIKFTESQGKIVVKARSVRTTREGTEVHVSVSDTGPGIPIDKQELIFEAFRQADGSVTRTHGGSGLGLRISKQLVELMGGRIWVESTVGKASEFHFTVEFRHGRQQSPAAAATETMRAMIVDRESQSRLDYANLFCQRGVKCALAGDINTARRIVKWANTSERPFDFVLIDGQVPGVEQAAAGLGTEIGDTPVIFIDDLQIDNEQLTPKRWSPPSSWIVLPRTFSDSELWNVILPAVSRFRPGVESLGAEQHGEIVETRKVLLVEDVSDMQLVRRKKSARGRIRYAARHGRHARTSAVRRDGRFRRKKSAWETPCGVIRRRIDGLADAGDGWPGGDRSDSPPRRRIRHAHTRYRIDRPCDGRH